MQNSNKQCKIPGTIKPLIGAKYIKYHNLKRSLKSIKGNRDLNAVVTLDVTVELGKAFHSGTNLSVKKIYVKMFYKKEQINDTYYHVNVKG